jgi:hypothetical protein
MKKISIFLWIVLACPWNTASAFVDNHGNLFLQWTAATKTNTALTKTNSIETIGEIRSLKQGIPSSLTEGDVSMAMDRDLSSVTRFSVLPQDYQMTLKQFLLSYETSNVEDFHYEQPVRFVYEDYMAADVIDARAFKAALSGTLGENTPRLEFHVNLIHGDKGSLKEELRYLNKKRTEGVFASPLFHVTLVNTSLACNTRKSLFLSLEDYYCLQNTLKVPASIFANSISKRTDSELRVHSEWGNRYLKDIAPYLKSYPSKLLAGWIDSDAVYGNREDTKTFEICGEIIVNF